jgi:hypothetical protein
MNPYKNMLPGTLLLTALLSAGCEKEVILDLPDHHGKYLVVEGNIDDLQAIQWIRLSTSSSYYDVTAGLPVSNASVTVTDGTVEFSFQESLVDSLKGYYFNYNISANLTRGMYYLRISTGDKRYTAQSEFRPVPNIDSVTVALNFFTGLGIIDETYYDIYVHFRDIPGNDNHYLVNTYINNTLQTFRPTQKKLIGNEGLFDNVSLSVSSIHGEDIKSGDMLTLEMRSISREKYNFYTDFLYQTRMSGNPFAGAPPANIPTNLSEGAMGFFQVSAVSTAQVRFRHINRNRN